MHFMIVVPIMCATSRSWASPAHPILGYSSPHPCRIHDIMTGASLASPKRQTKWPSSGKR